MHITWIGSVPLEILDRCIFSVFYICRKHFKRCVLLKNVFTSSCSLSQGLSVSPSSLSLLSTGIKGVLCHTRLAFHFCWAAPMWFGCCPSFLFCYFLFLLLCLYSFISVFIYPVLLRGSRGRFVSFRVSGFACQCCSK